MKKAQTLLNKFLHPPKWTLFTIVPLVFTLLLWVLATERDEGALAYAVYCMSAYCLIAMLLPLPEYIRKIKAGVMHSLTRTTFGEKYVRDIAFRGSVSICQGMIMNFLYVAFRTFVGIRYASAWFISMAVYYLVLGVMRLYLIRSYKRRNAQAELKCYRRTARLLFLLNIPMGGMIVLMVRANSSFSYPGYIIYLSALYTFYTVTVSVMNIVKFRRVGSPILSAAKVLNFVAALMSLLGLQTAMIARFSTNGEVFRKTMNAITGGGVWLFVILIAVYMLISSKNIEAEVKPVEPLGK